MKITEISIKRPPLVIVCLSVLVLLGLVSLLNLKYELLPDITPPYVTVSTYYPGASPQEVEMSVTKPVEDILADIGGVAHVKSTSYDSFSAVTLEFDHGVDPMAANQSVQKKVAQLPGTLPTAARTPVVNDFSLNDLPVLRIGVTAQMDPLELQRLVKDVVEPRLSRVKGVGGVILVGSQEREIQVNLDLARLSQVKLPVLGVVEALRGASSDIPAGTLKAPDGQTMTRLSGRFTSLDELGDVAVSQAAGQAPVLLRDVAEVSEGATELQSVNRIDGKAAIGILIKRQSGANDVEMSALVHKELGALETENKARGLAFQVAQDTSRFTLDSAEGVGHDLILAILLVALVMLAFLQSLRSSLIVMVSVPVSILTTFIGIYVFHFTLNLMTLLALSLVIGILVDDSIVVLENIFRHLEMGKDRKQAALDGRNEIGFAAVSITLVDVVVFLPLAFVSGMIGNIVREYALVVVLSALVSLLVSFTVTPMLASRFARLEDLNRKGFTAWFGRGFERFFSFVVKVYRRVLGWCLRHRKSTLGLVGLVFVGSLSLVALGLIGAEFVPQVDKGEIAVNIEAPLRATLLQTDQVVRTMEDRIWTIPEVKKVFATTGSTGDGEGVNLGTITVILAPAHDRTRSSAEVSSQILGMGKGFPGVRIHTAPVGIFGTGDSFSVGVTVSGSDREQIRAAADRVAAAMAEIRGTGEIKQTTTQGKPEMNIAVDRKRMAQLGLTLGDVGAQLRTEITGNDELKLRDGTHEYPVRIRADAVDVHSRADLEGLRFLNQQGQPVELRQFASITSTLGPDQLERRDRLATVMVLCQAVGRPGGDIANEIDAKLKTMTFDGVQISQVGEGSDMNDAFSSLLTALAIAIIFVYLIMVALFNSFTYPFIVLFSIPVAIVGALAALALSAKTLNIFSLLGIIMLVGLVGKHAILLVDRANRNREAGLSLWDSLLDAGTTRLRPIVMTTAAMVFGMLPIALAFGGNGAEMKASLGMVLVGGLTGSLFITVFLVPVVYSIVGGFQEKHRAKKQARTEGAAL